MSCSLLDRIDRRSLIGRVGEEDSEWRSEGMQGYMNESGEEIGCEEYGEDEDVFEDLNKDRWGQRGEEGESGEESVADLSGVRGGPESG